MHRQPVGLSVVLVKLIPKLFQRLLNCMFVYHFWLNFIVSCSTFEMKLRTHPRCCQWFLILMVHFKGLWSSSSIVLVIFNMVLIPKLMLRLWSRKLTRSIWHTKTARRWLLMLCMNLLPKLIAGMESCWKRSAHVIERLRMNDIRIVTVMNKPPKTGLITIFFPMRWAAWLVHLTHILQKDQILLVLYRKSTNGIFAFPPIKNLFSRCVVLWIPIWIRYGLKVTNTLLLKDLMNCEHLALKIWWKHVVRSLNTLVHRRSSSALCSRLSMVWVNSAWMHRNDH